MKRTINMTAARSEHLAICAASVGVDSETLIQSAISALIISFCNNDPNVRIAISRSLGMTWEELEILATNSRPEMPEARMFSDN